MGRLLDVADGLLVVIDAQPSFYGGEPVPAQAVALARAAWLTGVATALDVPVVVTEEDAARNGPTDPAIATRLPAGTPVLAKRVFDAADQPDILAAIEVTGRRTAVVVGLETDVCVAHSALGLLDRGIRVAVVDDATYSPGAMHDAGLRRIVASGGELVHAKGVYYEWIRTLDAARAFQRSHPDLADPPGFSL
jgi:nicotinamidase-related amidase